MRSYLDVGSCRNFWALSREWLPGAHHLLCMLMAEDATCCTTAKMGEGAALITYRKLGSEKL